MLFKAQHASSAGSAGVGEQSERSIVWQSMGVPPEAEGLTELMAKPTTKVRTCGLVVEVTRSFAMFSERSYGQFALDIGVSQEGLRSVFGAPSVSRMT